MLAKIYDHVVVLMLHLYVLKRFWSSLGYCFLKHSSKSIPVIDFHLNNLTLPSKNNSSDFHYFLLTLFTTDPLVAQGNSTIPPILEEVFILTIFSLVIVNQILFHFDCMQTKYLTTYEAELIFTSMFNMDTLKCHFED